MKVLEQFAEKCYAFEKTKTWRKIWTTKSKKKGGRKIPRMMKQA